MIPNNQWLILFKETVDELVVFGLFHCLKSQLNKLGLLLIFFIFFGSVYLLETADHVYMFNVPQVLNGPKDNSF
uniref:Uncharacterized protein n=1 Tax=Anguilla anguilla TaxID=7936 RepID=A0A0E9WU76_ANGAN